MFGTSNYWGSTVSSAAALATGVTPETHTFEIEVCGGPTLPATLHALGEVSIRQ